MRGLFDGALRLVALPAVVTVLLAACSAGGTPSGSPAPMASATSAPAVQAALTSDPAALEVFRGTWDYEVTDADPSELREWMADVAAEAGEPGAAVTVRFGFDHDRWWIGFFLDGGLWLLHGVPEGDGGVMTVDGDTLTMTNGTDGWMTYRWAVDGEQLTLDLVDCVNQARSGECIGKDEVSLLTSRTLTRSGTDPTY